METTASTPSTPCLSLCLFSPSLWRHFGDLHYVLQKLFVSDVLLVRLHVASPPTSSCLWTGSGLLQVPHCGASHRGSLTGCVVVWCTIWEEHMDIPIVEETEWRCLFVSCQYFIVVSQQGNVCRICYILWYSVWWTFSDANDANSIKFVGNYWHRNIKQAMMRTCVS